ncbi:MAG: aminodeoxychorismate/anthranilate synthase component II [Betaproteobacteria bacterium]|jgi:anthranilate synthase component II|nr:aminodeoxychorismate/anthranilate synthase component II [Betaproteobacteria bacterium]NBT10701.1 aminodeoxychorismate/anthranilate synthase component II [Betaproteobacteria bacterium]NBU50534.1 aminodeoxychorismate/anthranilate synthase component II [Betaproteobacteria bacterium]NBX96867.1 aminodeoxychorismate/anthranilate synthase component II [Betaproteobacteria bacterium]
MLLMIDNYDSFTYNLVQYLGELGAPVHVVRNDEVTVGDIEALAPSHLVFSPGPCSPAEAGICVQAIRHFMGRLPILGVCLGHQSIGAALGGRIVRAPEPKHGKTSLIQTDRKGVFAHLPRDITVIRYHSLVIEEATLPSELVVSARSEDGQIMAVRHRELTGGAAPMEGVQFHPESILSEHGHAMLRNFLCMGAQPLARAASSCA